MAHHVNAMTPDTLRRWWLGIGWLGVALVIYLSLMRNPPQIDIAQSDKVEHAAAYALLMCWFAQVSLALDRRVLIAAALVALGIAIEYAQRATGYRSFEYLDMVADAVGVALGWLLAPPRLPNFYAAAQRSVAKIR